MLGSSTSHGIHESSGSVSSREYLCLFSLNETNLLAYKRSEGSLRGGSTSYFIEWFTQFWIMPCRYCSLFSQFDCGILWPLVPYLTWSGIIDPRKGHNPFLSLLDTSWISVLIVTGVVHTDVDASDRVRAWLLPTLWTDNGRVVSKSSGSTLEFQHQEFHKLIPWSVTTFPLIQKVNPIAECC